MCFTINNYSYHLILIFELLQTIEKINKIASFNISVTGHAHIKWEQRGSLPPLVLAVILKKYNFYHYRSFMLLAHTSSPLPNSVQLSTPLTMEVKEPCEV